MFKPLLYLIISTIFATWTHAIDLNITNQILNTAMEATGEIQTKMEEVILAPFEEKETVPLIETTEIVETITGESDINQTSEKPEPTVNIKENNETKDSLKNITVHNEEEKPKKLTEEKVKEIIEKGDVVKGKNIYKYVLKDVCEVTGYEFAAKYNQEEWEEILETGKFTETLFNECKPLKKFYQDSWTKDLYQFFYESSEEEEIAEC